MRHPDKGFGSGRVCSFVIGGFEAKERTLPDLMNRGGWCPVALLVCGINQPGFWVSCGKAFSESMGVGGGSFAVGTDVKEMIVVDAAGVGLNAAFYEDKTFVVREFFKAVGIFTGFGGLGKMIGEVFVIICFKVVVKVVQSDDAVPGIDQELFVMRFDGHGLMKSGGVAFPFDLLFLSFLGLNHEPDIAIKGHDSMGSFFPGGNRYGAEVSFPLIG